MTLKKNKKIVIKRVLNLIRRKMIFKRKQALKFNNILNLQELNVRISLLDLKKYEMGAIELPICEMVKLLRCYGCSDHQIEIWNLKISCLLNRHLTHDE